MLIFRFLTRQQPLKTCTAIPVDTSPAAELATPLIGPAAAASPLVTIAPILPTPTPTDPMIPGETNTYRTE
jgi:hypothetical protein